MDSTKSWHSSHVSAKQVSRVRTVCTQGRHAPGTSRTALLAKSLGCLPFKRSWGKLDRYREWDAVRFWFSFNHASPERRLGVCDSGRVRPISLCVRRAVARVSDPQWRRHMGAADARLAAKESL